MGTADVGLFGELFLRYPAHLAHGGDDDAKLNESVPVLESRFILPCALPLSIDRIHLSLYVNRGWNTARSKKRFVDISSITIERACTIDILNRLDFSSREC